MSVLELILLVTAVSVDAFAAGFSYGVNRIKVPLVSVLMVSGISALLLGAALLVGCLAGSLVPSHLTKSVSFVILFVLGLTKLLDRSAHEEAERVNKNQDFCISPEEAVILGLVLSVDSLAAGIGAGIQAAQIPAACILSFAVGTMAIGLGRTLGQMLAARCKSNLCWLSGSLLLLLAFMKVF